jgi:hypothetical protein
MVKGVSFKEKKEKDLINFIKDKDFSYYVKNLIKKDMEKEENEVLKGKEKQKIRKRNTDFDIE